MANVIIVSRTRMAADCVCVGGVDIDNRRSLRLLDARGHHETADVCPYQIWDIWDIDYYPNQRRPNPHTEDVNVVRRQKMKAIDAPNMSVIRFAEVLEGANIPLFRGSLFSVFDGKLKLSDNDKFYISHDDIPNYSTCFWITDRRLLGYENSRGRWQYCYNDMSNRYGHTIAYVGTGEHPNNIEAGSLIRLSLAHWWKPEDSDDDERCYLQLSGCLISSCEKNKEVHTQEPTCSSNLVKDLLKGNQSKLIETSECYENSIIPVLTIITSNKVYGQMHLKLSFNAAKHLLSLEKKEDKVDYLGKCRIAFNAETTSYEVLPPTQTRTIVDFMY